MAHLLNSNPRVVLGIERYGGLLQSYCSDHDRIAGHDVDALFERERFLFDMRKEDNKPFPANELSAAAVKYGSAAYVGDKVPLLFRYMLPLSTACPTAKILSIVRDPVPVAASWQRRADNVEDSWPARNGYRASVTMWNESVDCALKAKQALGNRLAVVCYDTFFKTPVRHWFALMAWLEIPTHRPLYRYTRMMLTNAKRIAAKPRRVPRRIRKHVRAHARLDRWTLLMAKALRPLDQPADDLPPTAATYR